MWLYYKLQYIIYLTSDYINERGIIVKILVTALIKPLGMDQMVLWRDIKIIIVTKEFPDRLFYTTT